MTKAITSRWKQVKIAPFCDDRDRGHSIHMTASGIELDFVV